MTMEDSPCPIFDGVQVGDIHRAVDCNNDGIMSKSGYNESITVCRSMLTQTPATGSTSVRMEP